MTGKETGIKVRKGRDFAAPDASLPLCILTKLERREEDRPLDNVGFFKSDCGDYEPYYCAAGEKEEVTIDRALGTW